MIKAPWTLNQCAGLNDYQRNGYMHPFTCGCEDRSDAAHLRAAKQRGDRDNGLLDATPKGWVCPACNYTQDWAHEFMFDGRGRNPFACLAPSAPTQSTGAQAKPEPPQDLNPQTNEDRDTDWIEWKGGERPVGADVSVHARFRDGSGVSDYAAALRWEQGPAWKSDYDIVAYRRAYRPTSEGGEA